MSTILDALEKASKERAEKTGELISSDQLGKSGIADKRLKEEEAAHRRKMGV